MINAELNDHEKIYLGFLKSKLKQIHKQQFFNTLKQDRSNHIALIKTIHSYLYILLTLACVNQYQHISKTVVWPLDIFMKN